MIPYFSAHCISDHRISNTNPNPNPNPDNSPDHDCSHLLVRDAVVRNAVGRKGGHRNKYVSNILAVLHCSQFIDKNVSRLEANGNAHCGGK